MANFQDHSSSAKTNGHKPQRRLKFSADRTERCLGECEGVTAQVIYIEDTRIREVLVAVLKLSGTAATKRYTTIQKLQKLAVQDLTAGEVPDIFLSLSQIGLEDFPSTASKDRNEDELERIVRQYLNDNEDTVFLHDVGAPRKQTGSFVARSGPPTERHMIHCRGSIDKAIVTENLVTPRLEALGLLWHDVEDVFPAPDTSWLYLNRRRPQTWNQRIIYVAPGTDVDSLTEIWQTVLIQHAMFRSLSIPIPRSLDSQFGGAKHLFVTLRINENLWYQSITIGLEVESQEDLHNTFLGQWADPLYGPLVHVACVKIRNTNSSALILIGNQAAYDEASYALMLQDLTTKLTRCAQHTSHQIPGYIKFKDAADQLWMNRTSAESREAALYHVTRLRDISKEKACLWPKQRGIGWFQGADEGWLMPDGTPGDPKHRPNICTLDVKTMGTTGITRSLRVETLQDLQNMRGISVDVVLKVAVALFNMRKTGARTALFASRDIGSAHLSPTESPNHPHITSITGPIANIILNRIQLSQPNESVLGILNREQDEQLLLSKYSSAPLFQITELLNSADRDTFLEAIARQNYGLVASQSVETSSALVQIEKKCLDDVGLTWSFNFPEPYCIGLTATYDDCQLSSDEVLEAMGEILSAAAWLSNPLNLEKGVDECDFEDMELYELDS